MKQTLPEWTGNLEKIFQQEIEIYKELIELEKRKKETILVADGKKLEVLTEKTQQLIAKASEQESKRMRLITDVYQKEKLKQAGETPILSEFLNQIDRQSNFRLKGFANSLKQIVRNLKDKIMVNDKLLRTRQDIYSMSIDALKQASDIEMPSYEGNQKANKNRTSVLLNTQV